MWRRRWLRIRFAFWLKATDRPFISGFRDVASAEPHHFLYAISFTSSAWKCYAPGVFIYAVVLCLWVLYCERGCCAEFRAEQSYKLLLSTTAVGAACELFANVAMNSPARTERRAFRIAMKPYEMGNVGTRTRWRKREWNIPSEIQSMSEISSELKPLRAERCAFCLCDRRASNRDSGMSFNVFV